MNFLISSDESHMECKAMTYYFRCREMGRWLVSLVALLMVISLPGCSVETSQTASHFGEKMTGETGVLPAATNPYRAHEQRVLQWQDENGKIGRAHV